jgi:hypothetical protein
MSSALLFLLIAAFAVITPIVVIFVIILFVIAEKNRAKAPREPPSGTPERPGGAAA